MKFINHDQKVGDKPEATISYCYKDGVGIDRGRNMREEEKPEDGYMLKIIAPRCVYWRPA